MAPFLENMVGRRVFEYYFLYLDMSEKVKIKIKIGS